MKLVALSLVFLVVACSKKNVRESNGLNPTENSQVYFKSATELTVQVAFEPGAEPYTSIGTGNFTLLPLFWVLEENLNALYQGRPNPPSITVPKQLANFQALPAQNKASWTADEILDLARANRSGFSSSTHSYFYIVFLKGNFSDGSKVVPTTIGVSMGNTTVLAIFKDVVRSMGTGLGTTAGGVNLAEAVPKYVEQATMVHEMGHALGLVENGLPMKVAHKDSAHGAHCDNQDCVMYWVNEGASDMVAFATKMATQSSVVMYDQKCLDDARSY